jgi:hypothetical protein
MKGNLTLELTFTISILVILGTVGFSLAFKDHIANFMVGLVFKKVKTIARYLEMKGLL